MEFILTNIGQLVGITEMTKGPKRGDELNKVESMSNAFLHVKDGEIHDFGPMTEMRPSDIQIHDCEGRMVIPAFIDSHTHLVYAESRSKEFNMRLHGKSYQEIAAAGGGILNSARNIHEYDETRLYEDALLRIQEAIKGGTAAFEIKSGYGLDLENELKMLRVIRKLKKTTGIPIKATFLGAHALPEEFKNDKQAYINEVCNVMLPEIARERLADYIDIFCEDGYFDVIDLARVIEAGQNYGLHAKVHVNQFNSIGGVPLACKLGALSVDHLEVMTDTDIKALKRSNTIGVGLPLCSLFLNIPYTPMRELIDEGVIVALASDYNPGSSPSHNLQLAYSLACTQMKMTAEEAFNALTYNASFAMQIQHQMGSIEKGKMANLLILNDKAQALEDIPYWFGESLVKDVIIG